MIHKAKANVIMKDKLNKIIKKYAKIQVIEVSSQHIVLNNGVEITDSSEVRKFKRRTINLQIEFLKRFDHIYSGDEELSKNASKEARSASAVKGGKQVQKKYKDVIKKNLNTGTPWNKGKKGSQVSWSKGLTKETDTRIFTHRSKGRTGDRNPMYGKKLTDNHKQKISKSVTEKIQSGQFTPNSNNRNTHWESTLDGKKFRSSWEAVCQYLYPGAEYERLRVPYICDTKRRIYIIDFIDHTHKLVIEVKPKEFQTGRIYHAKIAAAKDWCWKNGYEFRLFDRDDVRTTIIPEYHHSRFDPDTIRKILKEQKRK